MPAAMTAGLTACSSFTVPTDPEGGAGRLIQLQNLPQNHLPDLEQAQDSMLLTVDYEMLEASRTIQYRQYCQN